MIFDAFLHFFTIFHKNRKIKLNIKIYYSMCFNLYVFYVPTIFDTVQLRLSHNKET